MDPGGAFYGRSSQMTEERLRDALEKQAKQRALREDLDSQMLERRRVLEATHGTASGFDPSDAPIGTAAVQTGLTKAQRRRQQMMQERNGNTVVASPSLNLGGRQASSSSFAEGGNAAGFPYPQQDYYAQQQPSPWQGGFAQQGGYPPYTQQQQPPTAAAYQTPQTMAPRFEQQQGGPYQRGVVQGARPAGANPADDSVYGLVHQSVTAGPTQGGAPWNNAHNGAPPTAPLRPSPPLGGPTRVPATQGAPPAPLLSPRVALPSVFTNAGGAAGSQQRAPPTQPAMLSQAELMQFLSQATERIFEHRTAGGGAAVGAGGPHNLATPTSSAYNGDQGAGPTHLGVVQHNARQSDSKREARGNINSRAKSRERAPPTASGGEPPQARQKVQKLEHELQHHQQALGKLQGQAKEWEATVAQLRSQLKNAKQKEKELNKLVQAKQPAGASGVPPHRAETAPNKHDAKGSRRVQLDPLLQQDQDHDGPNGSLRPITAPNLAPSPAPPHQETLRPSQAKQQPGAKGSVASAPQLPAIPSLASAAAAAQGPNAFSKNQWMASPREPPPKTAAVPVVVGGGHHANNTDSSAYQTNSQIKSPTKAGKQRAAAAAAALAPPPALDIGMSESAPASSSHVAVSLTRLAQLATIDQIITQLQAQQLWSHLATCGSVCVSSPNRNHVAKGPSSSAVGMGASEDDAPALKTFETFEELSAEYDYD